MANLTDYTICKGESIEALRQAVKTLLHQGYHPSGSITIGTAISTSGTIQMYYQPMIKH